jgi:hypothetical protein
MSRDIDAYKDIFNNIGHITRITLPYTDLTLQSVIFRCFAVEEFSVVI